MLNKLKRKGNSDYVRVKYGWKTYKIPVNARGYVPKMAIVERFQQFGNPNDIGKRAAKVLPSNVTPEEIIEWWVNPESCDIEGIDDDNSEVYNMNGVPPSHIQVQKKIAVLANDKEQKRIRQVLSESFSKEELERMSKNGSFIIRSVDDCGNATGCYYRKQNGVEIPVAVIEEGTTADGIVHEAVHHSRATDDSRKGLLATTFPTKKNGKLKMIKYLNFSKKKRDRIMEEEERRTTAETLIRTKKDKMQSGYYDYVPDSDSREAYLKDREILSNGKMKKGKAARYALINNYAYTNIAKAEILNRNMAKKRNKVRRE